LSLLGSNCKEQPPDPNNINLSIELPLADTDSKSKLEEKKASIYT